MKRAIVLCIALLASGCSIHQSYSLLPGQTLHIQNSSYRQISFRADYPISFEEGNCYLPWAVDARLICDPADITIIDTRPALLVWAHANRVDISAR